MEEETFLENPCEDCGGTNYTLDMGYYACTQCHTLSQVLGEFVYDYNFASQATNQKGISIKQTENKTKKRVLDSGLTSFETFNYILKGYVDELIYLGASPQLKIIVLQLWATLLQKSQVAFYSHKEEGMPKLAYNYYLHDANILYHIPNYIGKCHRIGQSIPSKPPSTIYSKSTKSRNQTSVSSDATSKSKVKGRKKRIYEELYKSDISINQSQASGLGELETSQSRGSNSGESDNDNASSFATLNTGSRKIISTKSIKKKDSNLIKKDMLLPLVYVALNIIDDNIEISDLFRWSREHNISTHMLKNFIPDEAFENSASLKYFLSQHSVSYSRFATNSGTVARKLGVSKGRLPNDPDLLKIVKRFLINMGLPDSLAKYVNRLLLAYPKLGSLAGSYTQELRAISLIIMTLKIIFGIDDATEDHLSEIAEKFNRLCINKDETFLFNWNNWVKFYECRKAVISKYHVPSHMHFYPNKSPDPDQYLSFMNNIKGLGDYKASKGLPKRFQDFEIILQGNSQNNDDENEKVPKLHFPATLYPWRDYLKIVLETPEISNGLPLHILEHNYQKDSLDFIFKPKQFIMYAETFGYKIKYRKGSLQKNTKLIHINEEPVYKTSIIDTKIFIKDEKARLLLQNNEDLDDCINLSDDSEDNNEDPETLIIPLAYYDYWMIEIKKMTQANGSKDYLVNIHSKLPPSFRWLIEEMAKLIEISPEKIFFDLVYLERLYYENVICHENED